MKIFGIIIKIVAALALIAGIVYIVATYGDKMVVWAKKLLGKTSGQCCEGECVCESECTCEEECCCEEAPAEESVQAEEADFEG